MAPYWRSTTACEERVVLSRFYENDRELVAVLFLVRHLHGKGDIHLYMPYIPNAGQDRIKGSEDGVQKYRDEYTSENIPEDNLLQTVFKDGKMAKDDTLDEMRQRLNGG